jgi:hypothetical protein
VFLWIVFAYSLDFADPYYGLLSIYIYSIITMGAGIVLNFVAWKKNARV